jgi:hypothetical protein
MNVRIEVCGAALEIEGIFLYEALKSRAVIARAEKVQSRSIVFAADELRWVAS